MTARRGALGIARTSAGAIGIAVLGAASSAQPANLRNARIESRRVEAGRFDREMRELASAPAERWIVWTAPANDPRNESCCFDSPSGIRGGRCCGTCSLDEGRSSNFGQPSERRTTTLEGPGDILVFARVAKGRVERLRVFSADCDIDAGGAAVVLLEGVRPAEELAYLESLVSSAAAGRAGADDEEPESPSSRLVGSGLAAIAMQAGADADAALERLAASGRPLALRKKAAFWLGNSRGRAGYEILERAVRSDPDDRFRKHASFALSQSPVPEAVPTLIGMARHDSSAEVRGQALFWLAQKAGRKAAAALEESIQEDPDTEVKKKAVFALTQLPDGEGVTQLIRVARTNRNPEVRRRAIFWLGQSRDPRALEFLEEILSR